MQNKFKHNKKRNTAFLFEALVKELTKVTVEGDKSKQKTISVLIKEHFKKGGPLDRELTLYKQLYATKEFPKDIAEKLLNQVKAEHEKLNETEIFNEQSKLIGKINKFVGPHVFNNFVPSYKTLASVSQIFNKSVEPKQKVLLEQEILETITAETKEKKVILERIDSLALKRFVERFNETYSDKLLSEQKQILSKFINHSEEDIELKIYLNEEIDRLKESVAKSLSNELVKGNAEILQNAKTLQKVLNNLKVSNINEELIKKIMYIQEFVSEVQK
jgi:hypothetical protein